MRNSISACQVLLLEDEAAVSILIEDMLEEIGCRVVASAARVDHALSVVTSDTIDFAVLDVNVGGANSYQVADALIGRSIPFIFSTGYGKSGVDPKYQFAPVLQKPFSAEELQAALSCALGGARPVARSD